MRLGVVRKTMNGLLVYIAQVGTSVHSTVAIAGLVLLILLWLTCPLQLLHPPILAQCLTLLKCGRSVVVI